MKKSFKSGLIVLILIILISAAFVVKTMLDSRNPTMTVTYASRGNKVSNYNPELAKNYKRNYIAALYIEGTIQEANQDYDQKWLMDTIHSLKTDEKNVAIAIYINSPGGAVYQADEVYLALMEYKTSGKPIYVYQGPMAASGGYYISCAGDEIYANRNTLTGCIGVIFGSSYDLTELFDNIGIKSETIHSGKNKNMFNYNEPVTDEQREIMQSICDECYEQFVSIVAKQRLMNYNDAAELSDGRLYTAKQALENGLIDKIDSWDNMIRDLSENELEMPGIKVVSFKKEKKMNLVDYMTGLAKKYTSAKAAANLGLPESVIEDINNKDYIPLYLYK
ncbi:MAG: signal peptide peptidase SppA [Treponema sp.]|nr:signal peptide peptidase SppA [Treponema sp.]